MRRLLLRPRFNHLQGYRRTFSVSTASHDSLVVAELAGGSLAPNTLNTISAALKIGPNVDVLVVGKSVEAAAKASAEVQGVRTVLTVDDASYENPVAEIMSQAVAAVQKQRNYTHLLTPASATGKNFMPRLGAIFDVQPLTDVQEVVNENTFVRPIYAGNALLKVETSDPLKILTVRATAFPKAEKGGSASIESVPAPKIEGRVAEFLKREVNVSERPELTAADRVVSGGRALKSAENFNLLYKFADNIGAAVGASRAAVDEGMAPNDLQVGQTGKVVAPTLYFAFGISGAIQHLAGMKDSKVIVAVNTDPEAPIFQVANYGLVQDLFTAIPEIEAELKKQA